MSDPKTPKETPENQVSDTDPSAETPETELETQNTDKIEDAEILDEKPAEPDGHETDTTAESVEIQEANAEATREAEGTDGDADPDKPEPDTSEDKDLSEQEPAPEETRSEPSEKAAEKKGGFMGPFLGGVVAAGIGFGLCFYLVDQGILATGDPDAFAAERAQITGLEDQIAALQSEVASALEAAGNEDPRVAAVIGSVENVEAALAAVQGEVETVQSEISAQSGILASIEAQMEAIAELPAGTGTADTAAMAALQATLAQQQAENEAMQAQLSEMAAAAEAEMAQVRAQAGALQSETQAAVDAATNRAALANISAALESGAPLATSLDNLTVDAPDALTAVAGSGVETLLDLQRQFPAAARAGLAESLKATVSDDPVDRAVSFLRAQVGARSLEPREGDDPDAILSRAQEAVSSGQLDAALAEISALPDAGQSAMADWIGAAEARVAALAAFDALAAELNSN